MKKAVSIIWNIILWVFLIFSVVMAVLVVSSQNSSDGIANVGGKGVINILTQSMEPTIKTGDVIITQVLTNEEKADCKKGDIITFYADLNNDGTNELNTHRIVEVRKDAGYTYYQTKGDNNTLADLSEIDNTQVVGKYTGKRYANIGKALNWLEGSVGFLAVIVIPLAVVFIYELYNFISVITKMKNKGKISEEEEEEIKRLAVDQYLKEKQASETKDESVK